MTPSTKMLLLRSPPISANGKTTIERRGGADFPVVGRHGLRRLEPLGIERIDQDRFGNIFELSRTAIDDGTIDPPLDLPVGLLG